MIIIYLVVVDSIRVVVAADNGTAVDPAVVVVVDLAVAESVLAFAMGKNKDSTNI